MIRRKEKMKNKEEVRSVSVDVFKVSYRPMRFLMSEEVRVITDELDPVEGETYYIDNEALEKLEKGGMHTEVLKKLRRKVRESKYQGFDISISE